MAPAAYGAFLRYDLDVIPSSSAIDEQIYWAALTDPKQFVTAVMTRHASNLRQFSLSGRLKRAAGLMSAYCGAGTQGDKDTAELKDGEVTEWSVNTLRPVVVTALGLIAGTRPAVKPRARNSDAKSLAQTRLAAQLLENYANEDSGQELELATVRWGLLATAWTLGQAWAPREGQIFGVGADGVPVHDGALVQFTLPPWRVTYDSTAADVSQRRWAIFARLQDRFEIAAQLDEMKRPVEAEKLRKGVLGVSPTSADLTASSTLVGGIQGLSMLANLLEEVPRDADSVWVWEVRHRPTAALPAGRLVRFITDEIILTDTGYPYTPDDLHLYEYAPERAGAGLSGHSGMADVLGCQELIDIATTSVATTANLNGVPHLWTPHADSQPMVTRLSSGPTLVSTPQKPELIDFPALKPEVLAAADWAQSQARQAAALNDVVMGQPEKGMPASAQALQRAQAVQFNQTAQAEYVRLVKRANNGALRMWKKFATTPRMASIVGQGETYELREWSAPDVVAVERVDVEPVRPEANSFEAKQATAEILLERGLIKTAEDYLSFLQTGNLRKVVSPVTRQLERAEKLQRQLLEGATLPPVDPVASAQAGAPVFVEDGKQHLLLLASDPHHLVIESFQAVLNGAEDEAIQRAATEAIDYSLSLWRGLDADQCQAYGVPPLPSHMGAAPVEEPAESLEAESESPPQGELPRPPEDPLTGTREDAPPV